MKQTFTIPDGCKAFTVEQANNRLVVTFEPEVKERWRAAYRHYYWIIDSEFNVLESIDYRSESPNKRHENGNYFKTKKEAQLYADYMKECSLKFHEK